MICHVTVVYIISTPPSFIIIFVFIFIFSWHRREHKTCEFELHDVFAVDVIVSTGDGKVGTCS